MTEPSESGDRSELERHLGQLMLRLDNEKSPIERVCLEDQINAVEALIRYQARG